MTKVQNYEVGCKCGYAGRADFYDSVNVTVSPELKESVQNRSINSFICPQCGGRNELLKKFLYVDADNSLWVWCFPEDRRADYKNIQEQIDADAVFLKKEFGEDKYIEPKIAFGFDELLALVG